MTKLERELYWEMVRTIKLLGGKSDILEVLNTMDTAMPQGEAAEETYKLVKCWNDNVEEKLEKVTGNPLYESIYDFPCGLQLGE